MTKAQIDRQHELGACSTSKRQRMEEIIKEYRKREISLDKVALQPDRDGGIPMDLDDGFTIPKKKRSPAKKPPTPPRQKAAPHHQPQWAPDPGGCEGGRRSSEAGSPMQETREGERETAVGVSTGKTATRERRSPTNPGREARPSTSAPFGTVHGPEYHRRPRIRSVEDKETPGGRRSRQRGETD